MAGWITHLRIADEVLRVLPELDETGFCLGSIAPDCNVENADWTAFTPPREVTHFMDGSRKTPDGGKRFLKAYVCGRTAFDDPQELAFLLGYWAHLAADAGWQAFIREETRVQAMWQRIRAVPELAALAQGMPETFDTVKALWPKQRRMAEVEALESEYLHAHPESGYWTVLQTVKTFPDYLDFLPRGAIVRKIGVMGGVPPKPVGETEPVFFTRQEVDACIAAICSHIIEEIKNLTFIIKK